jgi:hypothetical protein
MVPQLCGSLKLILQPISKEGQISLVFDDSDLLIIDDSCRFNHSFMVALHPVHNISGLASRHFKEKRESVNPIQSTCGILDRYFSDGESFLVLMCPNWSLSLHRHSHI